jgi:hypothetical protein
VSMRALDDPKMSIQWRGDDNRPLPAVYALLPLAGYRLRCVQRESGETSVIFP